MDAGLLYTLNASLQTYFVPKICFLFQLDFKIHAESYLPDKEEDRCPWFEFLSARLWEWGSKPKQRNIQSLGHAKAKVLVTQSRRHSQIEY